MTKVNTLSLVICVLSMVGCTGSRSEASQRDDSDPVLQETESTNPVTLAELASSTGFDWRPETGSFAGRCWVQSCPAPELDIELLVSLPESERAEIRSIGISGTELLNDGQFDFSFFPELTSLTISSTNLSTIAGIDKAQINYISLGMVPLTDLSPIEGLVRVQNLTITTTEAVRLPTDLSRLENVEEFGIQASPLETLDGIETIPTDFHLIVGDVNDISAIARSNATWVTMPVEVQERFPEEVAALNEMGIAVTDAFE